MKPVCYRCQRFYRPKKTGYFFVEGMPTVRNALPGTEEPQHWAPYKLWVGDLWECQGCGHQLISGVIAKGPIAERHHEDFTAKVERYAATYQVNDC